LGQRRKNPKPLFVVELLYGAENVPRHAVGRGEGASARGKTNTASRWPPAHGGDEDDFVLGYFSDEGVRAGVWAVLGLRLLGCSAGFCWATSAR
jgi:hypothetical protein